jgi:hypothetical protein
MINPEIAISALSAIVDCSACRLGLSFLIGFFRSGVLVATP